MDKIPAKTELTVVSGDDPEQRTIGWTAREYNGAEIYLYQEGAKEPVKTSEHLEVGQEVLVPSLMGGYYRMTIQLQEDRLVAQSEHLIALLEYDQDDRHTWVTTCMINTRGIKKLALNSSDPIRGKNQQVVMLDVAAFDEQSTVYDKPKDPE